MASALIISNDEGTRYLYQVAISYQKIKVDVANDIAGGLKKLNSSKHDLVILDVMVPDIKNVAQLRILKGKTKSMPLIIITDMHNGSKKNEASILGACKYMARGESSLGELIKTVRKAVK